MVRLPGNVWPPSAVEFNDSNEAILSVAQDDLSANCTGYVRLVGVKYTNMIVHRPHTRFSVTRIITYVPGGDGCTALLLHCTL